MAKNLLSISDLSKQDMLDLIEFSNNFIDDQGNFRKEDLFPDKIVANVFCEPSTRTKSSFAIAASNLGCSVIDFDINTSSIQKGESIYETVDALNLMGVDLCVLRHPESVIRELAESLPKMSFVNAIRDAGGQCNKCFVIFHYNIFKQKIDKLKAQNVSIIELATWKNIIDVLYSRKIPESRIASIESFLKNPNEWKPK